MERLQQLANSIKMDYQKELDDIYKKALDLVRQAEKNGIKADEIDKLRKAIEAIGNQVELKRSLTLFYNHEKCTHFLQQPKYHRPIILYLC